MWLLLGGIDSCHTGRSTCTRLWACEELASKHRHITSPACIPCPDCFAQVDIRVFANMPEANETTEGSVPNYVGLMTWLHDHMTMKGEWAALNSPINRLMLTNGRPHDHEG